MGAHGWVVGICQPWGQFFYLGAGWPQWKPLGIPGTHLPPKRGSWLISFSIRSNVTGQHHDQQDERLTSQLPNQSGHCLLTSHYFKPCTRWLISLFSLFIKSFTAFNNKDYIFFFCHAIVKQVTGRILYEHFPSLFTLCVNNE